jgi:hypothetical protein
MKTVMTYSSEEIFEAARSIRPYLAQLLNPEAAQITDQQLSELLAQIQQEPTNISKQILRLLSSQETTREWVKKFLQDKLLPEIEKAYQPTLSPNPSSPISGLIKYACPDGDYVWYQRQVGEPIPTCPTHKVTLEKVS